MPNRFLSVVELKRVGVQLLLAMALLCGWTAALASTDPLQHGMVKSAFVLNIAKFVTWPASVYDARPDRLILCHYRHDSLGDAFEIIRNRSVDGRVLDKAVVPNLSSVEGCDILFSSREQLAQLGRESKTQPVRSVLTIADMTSQESTGTPYAGIQVALVRKGAKIGFEVNLNELNKAGLKVSSELLKLARIVGEGS